MNEMEATLDRYLTARELLAIRTVQYLYEEMLEKMDAELFGLREEKQKIARELESLKVMKFVREWDCSGLTFNGRE